METIIKRFTSVLCFQGQRGNVGAPGPKGKDGFMVRASNVSLLV